MKLHVALALSLFTQVISAESDKQQDTPRLRGSDHEARALAVSCNLCEGTYQYTSPRGWYSNRVVTLTGYGNHTCDPSGFFNATLNGRIISGQNECQAVREEYAPICCFADPDKPLQRVPAGTCGGGLRGDGVCADPSLCCSPYGYCGTGPAYCMGN